VQLDIDFDSISVFDLDDHLVLLKNGANNVQILTPLAKYIWNALKDGLDGERIAKDIAGQFDISFDLALRDVNNTIELWLMEFSEAYSPLDDSLSGWSPIIETVFSFPHFTVCIRHDSHEVADMLGSMLPHVETVKTGGADYVVDVRSHGYRYLIITNGEISETSETKQDAAVMAFREIVKLHCSRKDWLAVLHASGAAWQNDGIIFPASSGSGKTTLVAALIRHGFHYINDDVIPLERNTCNLIPAPLSLCIKSGSWEALSTFYPELAKLRSFSRYKVQVKYLSPPPDEFTQLTYVARYLIIPRYGPNSKHSLQSVSSADGLQAIIEGNSRLSQPLEPKETGELIDWVSKLSCYQLSYNNLDEAVATLTQLVSQDVQK
jgi:hypothetical protein